jgi:transcriptional regulator with XRE-family HTH domain
LSVGQPTYATLAEQQFLTVRGRLSERRRALGMSMSELARTIGVSPSLISQIERGQSLPSVETLFALSAALGATVDMFFSPGAVEPAAPKSEPPQVRCHRYVLRSSERPAVEVNGGVRWERLTPQSLDNVEFLELIYEPRAQSNENLYRHPGFEMAYVIEGRFDIYIGFDRHELGVGDSIAFASALPHRYVNPTDRVSRAVYTVLRDGIADAATSD